MKFRSATNQSPGKSRVEKTGSFYKVVDRREGKLSRHSSMLHAQLGTNSLEDIRKRQRRMRCCWYYAAEHSKLFRVRRSSVISVVDPGSGAFLTPGSGIQNGFFPDPGSQDHILKSFLTIFWVKSSIIL